jgi:hypothetical protein
MKNITVRLKLQGFTDRLECEPNRQHQAVGQCRVWRSTARIREGELIGRNARRVADPADLASKRFQCGGIVASGRAGSRNRGHIAS